MTIFQRYAVYWAPQAGPLAGFLANWLGRDAVANKARPHPTIADLPAPASSITRTPRKYGAHATLKPPFRLAEGEDFDTLRAGFHGLAAKLAPVIMEGLILNRLGGFLALTPTGDPTALGSLAAACVRNLDHFRAPAPPDDLKRRRVNGLSAAQKRNLIIWGYPYVLDEFRFHVTLTGKLDPATADATKAALAPVLAPLLLAPFRIDDICLYGEDQNSLFHEIDRAPLSA